MTVGRLTLWAAPFETVGPEATVVVRTRRGQMHSEAELRLTWSGTADIAKELCVAGKGRRAVASPHHLATEAGRAALERGGNALDAAIATSAVLAVVYPHMTSMAGDLFAVVARSDGEAVAVDGSGTALQATVDALRLGDQMPSTGPLTVTTPGCLAGLAGLTDLGARRPLGDNLVDARRLARDGVEMAPSVSRALTGFPHLLESSSFAAIFAGDDGAPLQAGDRLYQPALAATLDEIADAGVEVFYEGALGRRFVDGVRELGVPMSTEDLAGCSVEIRPPLIHSWRGLELVTSPPSSQGVTLLRMARVLENLGLTGDPFAGDIALRVAVTRRVMAERERNLADPRFHNDLDVEAWLKAPLGREGPVTLSAPGPSGDTVAVVTADEHGNAVSLIQSVYRQFGSGLLEPSTGLLCHNRGAAFVLDPTHPNVLAAGKRPAHTLMPVLVRRDGRCAAVLGTMGGRAQPQILWQLLVRLFVQGMDVDEALEAPRWVTGDRDLGYPGGAVLVEGRREVQGVLGALSRVHVDAVEVAPYDEEVGHAQAIVLGDRVVAASDPRSDGSAVVW